jgi:hypothetical protein
VGDAGAASLAQALGKNTTLQTLSLFGDCVVVYCGWGGGLIFVYVVVGCCWFVVWMEGRVRGVDCVCAAESPCSSDNRVGDAGAASLAQALEKNTTLQGLSLRSEFVVLYCVFVVCCVCGGGLIAVYVVVGCFWFVFGMEERVRGVDCVCATEPPCSQTTVWATRGLHRWRKL